MLSGALILSSLWSHAGLAEPKEMPLGWGYELGFTSANQGTGLRFLIETANVSIEPHESGERKDAFSFLFGSNSLRVSDESVDMASLGLRIRRLVEGYDNVSYLDINALYTYRGEQSFYGTDESVWGARVSFGFDLPYAQYERSFNEGEYLYGYLFVEGGWLLGFPGADGVNPGTESINGVHLTTGFKARY